MIDEEVDIVLREIRERVVSQPVREIPSAEPSTFGSNGDAGSRSLMGAGPHASHSEALARLNAHLTTTARAWDRLPPVFSNRSGTAARFEVWIKGRLKAFSRWFTWEQVNFNAAVHHALGETAQTLTEQAAEIAVLRSAEGESRTQQEALRAEIQAMRSDFEAEILSQRAEIDSLRAQLQADAAAKRLDLQNQQREVNLLRAETRGELQELRIRGEDLGTELRSAIETQKDEANASLARLAEEMRERTDVIENEQRVCFKQLSLEVNEAAVSSDRSQQKTRALLEEIDRRVNRLEKPDQSASK